MDYDVAKRNRLTGKFDFNQRDWHFELDGLDVVPRVPHKIGRLRTPEGRGDADRDHLRRVTSDECAHRRR